MSTETMEQKTNPLEKKETVESKEIGADEQLEAAAAMERADYLIKEVKSSKKQMQNIIRNMAQVTQAIRQLRARLQVNDSDDDDDSLIQDRRYVEKLKNKIAYYQDELKKMKGDLIREQIEELKKTHPHSGWSEIEARAENLVEKMIQSVVADEN